MHFDHQTNLQYCFGWNPTTVNYLIQWKLINFLAERLCYVYVLLIWKQQLAIQVACVVVVAVMKGGCGCGCGANSAGLRRVKHFGETRPRHQT